MLLESLNISVSSLMAGLIFGVIGLWMFRQGRKNSNLYFVMIGLILMIYPYFTSGPLADWGIGVALCGIGYYYKDQ